MCTNPITITKQSPLNKTLQYTVPCGKCSECRDSYQSQFEFLCAVEASKKGSLHFFTLTYDNTHLPVNLIRYSEKDCDNVVIGMHRASCCRSWQVNQWYKDGCSLVADDDAGMCVPSLHRKDVQLWLKRFRQYLVRHDLKVDFSFACFGEYGEKRKRPHYHCLVAGLSNELATVLSNLWGNGFCLCKAVNRFNSDGSDAFGLVSQYVSKYICKRDHLPDFVLDGYAEEPRRQTSIGFGSGVIDIDALRPFLFSGGFEGFSYLSSFTGN